MSPVPPMTTIFMMNLPCRCAGDHSAIRSSKKTEQRPTCDSNLPGVPLIWLF